MCQTWSPALKYRRIDPHKKSPLKLLPKCRWTLHSLRLNDKDNFNKNVTIENFHEEDKTFKYPSLEKLKAELKEIAPSLYQG